jgi:Dyp-type peroxidase family
MPKLTDREPLDEFKPDHQNLLADLQCNILSSHGRPNTHYFFLRFPDGLTARRLLGMLARGEALPKDIELESELSSRIRRLVKRAAAKAESREPSAGFSTNILLTARCYSEFLAGDGRGFDGFIAPSDAAFRQGMATRDDTLRGAAKLNDSSALRCASPVHALYVVGYDLEAEAWGLVREQILALLQKHGVTLREEAGYVLRDPTDTYPIEPFGYRDAISQPLFFKTDLERAVEYKGAAATVQERNGSSFAPLSLVLVPDPNGRSKESSGTYFVYRKIKQKVDFFYEQAQQLADKLATLPTPIPLSWEDVADHLIGRRVNGTPLEASPNLDDFTYPKHGALCPAHAHVRKVNPRATYSASRRIVRRGTVFGPRLVRESNGRPKLPTRSEPGEPSSDVGLLFFCCQADITQQFETIQGQWANANKVKSRPDTVIGQLPPAVPHKIGFKDNAPSLDYQPVVEVMEGDYFFAPSISFLTSNL